LPGAIDLHAKQLAHDFNATVSETVIESLDLTGWFMQETFNDRMRKKLNAIGIGLR
jgi:hypothetical protein